MLYNVDFREDMKIVYRRGSVRVRLSLSITYQNNFYYNSYWVKHYSWKVI
jgi:c-di-GMP-binding flagellar brake protein YcgR